MSPPKQNTRSPNGKGDQSPGLSLVEKIASFGKTAGGFTADLFMETLDQEPSPDANRTSTTPAKRGIFQKISTTRKLGHEKSEKPDKDDGFSPRTFAQLKHAAALGLPISDDHNNKKQTDDGTIVLKPDIARWIIQNYLMPLFQRISLISRQEKSDVRGARLASGGAKSTLQQETRLSDRLLAQLQKYRTESLEMSKCVSESDKEKNDLQNELTARELLLRDLLLEFKMRCHSQENFMDINMRECSRICDDLFAEQTRILSSLNAEQKESRRLKGILAEQDHRIEALAISAAHRGVEVRPQQLSNNVLAEQAKSLHRCLKSLKRAPVTTTDSKDDQAQAPMGSTITSAYPKVEPEHHKKHRLEMKRLHDAKEEVEKDLSSLVDNRNNLETTRRELTEGKEFFAEEKRVKQEETEETATRYYNEMKEALGDRASVAKEREKLDKKVRDLTDDKDKLKQRLKKFRSRRLKFEQEQKTCKRCGKEYYENDNYNWSCRTHSSEFGGEMWWCCGKLGKDAIGCRFAKHESKEDEDDLDEQEKQEREERASKMRNMSTRCYCCKELGHFAKDCPVDPNVRTKYDSNNDLARLNAMAIMKKKTVRLIKPNDLIDQIEKITGVLTWDEPLETLQHTTTPYKEIVEAGLKIANKLETKRAESAMWRELTTAAADVKITHATATIISQQTQPAGKAGTMGKAMDSSSDSSGLDSVSESEDETGSTSKSKSISGGTDQNSKSESGIEQISEKRSRSSKEQILQGPLDAVQELHRSGEGGSWGSKERPVASKEELGTSKERADIQADAENTATDRQGSGESASSKESA